MANIKYILIGALFAVLIYAKGVIIGNFIIYPRFLAAFIGLIIILKNKKFTNLLLPLLAIIPLILSIIIVSISNDKHGEGFGLIFNIAKGIILPYFCAFFIVYFSGLFKCNPNFDRKIISLILWAQVFQLAVVMIMIISPAVQQYVIAHINLSEGWRLNAEGGHFRYTGIGGVSLYDASLTYFIICVILIYYSFYGIKDKSLGLIFIISLVLSVLHGRTGFILILLLYFLMFTTLIVTKKLTNLLYTVTIYLIFAFVLFYLTVNEDLIKNIIEFSLEIFINFFEGNGFSSGSTDDLFQNHLVIGDNLNILLGSGMWLDAFYDSGIILLINYGGLIFTLLFFTCIYYFIKLQTKYLYQLVALNRSNISKLTLSIFMITIIISIKGPIFFSEHYMTALFFIIFIAARDRVIK